MYPFRTPLLRCAQVEMTGVRDPYCWYRSMCPDFLAFVCGRWLPLRSDGSPFLLLLDYIIVYVEAPRGW